MNQTSGGWSSNFTPPDDSDSDDSSSWYVYERDPRCNRFLSYKNYNVRRELFPFQEERFNTNLIKYIDRLERDGPSTDDDNYNDIDRLLYFI